MPVIYALHCGVMGDLTPLFLFEIIGRSVIHSVYMADKN